MKRVSLEQARKLKELGFDKETDEEVESALLDELILILEEK